MVKQKDINIDNFNQDSQQVKLSSPRSIEACMRLGIMPMELSKVSMEQIENEVKASTKQ